MSLASLPPSQTLADRPTPNWKLRRRWRRMTLLLGVVAMMGVLLLPLARNLKRKLFAPRPPPVPVRVAHSAPAEGATDVPLDVTFRITLRLGASGIDPSTVSSHSVRLIRTGDQAPVESRVWLDGENQIHVRPDRQLEPQTNYNLLFTPVVTDLSGLAMRPVAMGFTTAGATRTPIAFERVDLPPTSGFSWTCVQVGPDRKLYASCDDGRIYRFPIAPDGTLSEPQLIDSLRQHHGGARLLTGFCFDPASTAENLIVYAAHSFYAYENAPDLSGMVSRLSGTDLQNIHDLITGLPRSVGDHTTNQPSFGPDGCLYIPQPSNTAFGDPDPTWGMRPERKLNATILRLDLKMLGDRTLDARTPDVGGTFDPDAPDSLMTVYADGVRLAYDLVWHSNGNLYVPINGSSSGGNVPGSPSIPAIRAIATSEDDWLVRVLPGRYYGHPNPANGTYVLNGGNPTEQYDFGEVCQYPLGTMPDARWHRPAWVIGQHFSPNGIIEYRSDSFGGALRGRLLICRYSRGKDILIVNLDENGTVSSVDAQIPGLRDFQNPLDLVEDLTNGNLYVADLMARKIILCRPKTPGGSSVDDGSL